MRRHGEEKMRAGRLRSLMMEWAARVCHIPVPCAGCGECGPRGRDLGVAADYLCDLTHVRGIDRAVPIDIGSLLLDIGKSGSATEMTGNEGDIANGGDAVVIEVAESGSLLRHEWKAE